MAILYSYCIPVDDGAAPNPYWGVCTLAICKPVIRRNAKIGDWVVGTGSKKYGMQNKVVYAMKITDVKTLKEYDNLCKIKYPNKIPELSNKDLRKRAGDCIYFYEKGKLVQRKGVHAAGNYSTDTNGKNVLLSEHFFYFGDQPIELPIELLPIIKQGQGHKSRSNSKHVNTFIEWIEKNVRTKKYLNKHKGVPFLLEQTFAKGNTNHSANCRKKEAIEDELIPHKC